MKKLVIILLLLCNCSILTYASEEVILGGESIGVKLQYDGVVVVGYYNHDNAHIKMGECIYEVDGKKINSIADFHNALVNSDSQVVMVKIRNESGNHQTKLKINKDENKIVTHGLYVKEATLGIATITYYDPDNQMYGALGHEISDQSNMIIPFQSGSIYQVYIDSIQKSQKHAIGQKQGELNEDKRVGDVEINSGYGIFGKMNEAYQGQKIKWAKSDKVQLGKALAYIECSDNKVKAYAIEITKLHSIKTHDKKGIEFTIKDDSLLNECGGVVQGMSGSPIVQNGKLVGAITHVNMLEPNKGYGIYIEKMLDMTQTNQ